MYDFLDGFSSPASILADQNVLFSVFVTNFENENSVNLLPKPHYLTFIGTT